MPGNDIPEEYRCDSSLWRQERKGVRIIRARLEPRKTGTLNRVANYLSFWHSANALVKQLDDDFDVVIGYQFSPILQVDPAVKYAERTGAPLLLYSFDLWPESLVVGGIKRNGILFKWMKAVSRRIYSSADTLAATSVSFFDYFEAELNLKPKREVYLPQYAEDVFDEVATSAVDGELFPADFTHFMFAGNVGSAQSVNTIVEAANYLKQERCLFHIIGSGSALMSCKKLADSYSLDNVLFHGRHELEGMPAYYAKADAMLATLAGSPIIKYTLPRKVQSYLAASKPIIGTLAGEGKRVIEEAGCGFCCDIEDAKGLARACKEFMALPVETRVAMGVKARAYYEEHFSKERFYAIMERELQELKGTKHGN